MAGRLARTIGARALLLTHFSQRYHPNAHAVMATIASQAARAAQLPPHAVAAAYDALVVPLWAPDRDKPVLPPEALSPSPSHSSSSPTPLGDEADEGWQSIRQGQYASELADAQDW